jgi:hypothetical protein
VRVSKKNDFTEISELQEVRLGAENSLKQGIIMKLKEMECLLTLWECDWMMW